MKKLTPHHVLTPKGGRVAARLRERPAMIIAARPKPLVFPFYFTMPMTNEPVIVTGNEKVNRTRKRGA